MSELRPPAGSKALEKYQKGLLMVRNHGQNLRHRLSGRGWRIGYDERLVQHVIRVTDGVFTAMELEDQQKGLAFAEFHGLDGEFISVLFDGEALP